MPKIETVRGIENLKDLVNDTGHTACSPNLLGQNNGAGKHSC
jgi:hypothetical protein